MDSPENKDPVDPVETDRESSGQARIAGVGDVDGEGDSRRKDGREERSCSSCDSKVVAMIEIRY